MARHPSAQERAECVRLYSSGALLKHLVVLYRRERPVISRWIAKAGAKRGHKFRGRALDCRLAEDGRKLAAVAA